MLLAGVVLGTVAALVAGRLLRGLLYAVHPADPATIGAAATLLSCVALLATYLPARRATRVDPLTALRSD
jgi:ABC-type antimicrobial peptide transport system permease subunit